MNKLFSCFIMCLFLILPFNKVFAQSYDNALPYNYLDTKSIPIYLTITKEISTEEAIVDGQTVEFKVMRDVVYNEKILLKRGDIVKAKVETVITAGMNGFPAEIIIDDFQIPNVKSSQLISTYNKKGQNRCLWVYPLKWSLTLIPFVGSLTNLIMGGHARIKTNDVVTLYYYPNWK